VNLSPLTRKRLARFRANRRACIALGLLAFLYLLSLGAGLLCNDRPLYLRYCGKTFWPAFRSYSCEEVTGDASRTRPDYLALAGSDAFRADPGNRVLFPPFRTSPYAVVDPDAFEAYRLVRLTVRPRIATGRFNLAADGAIARPENLAAFETGDDGSLAAGIVFRDRWLPSPDFDEAVRLRFANEAAPAVSTCVTNRASGLAALATFTAFAPRTPAPPSVRVTLRPIDTPTAAPATLEFARRGGDSLDFVSRRAAKRLSGETRASLLALAERVAAGDSLAGETIEWDGSIADVSGRRPEVSWPHRPVPGHWMGVDAVGRDVFARVLYGMRTALSFGLLLVAWAVLLGCIVGAVQGYFGGWVDIAFQRTIEIWSALPFLYVMILVGAVLGRGFGLLLLCYGLFNWIGVSYYLRAEFLRLRGRPFVDAARCQGLGTARIIFRHVLPNALTPVVTLLPFNLVGAISSLTALDYLGFGLPPLTPSWGELLQQAQAFRRAWWLTVYPSLALFTVMILAVLVGEGMRDAFDPRRPGRIEG
jgi:microcin C transport system permease protein